MLCFHQGLSDVKRVLSAVAILIDDILASLFGFTIPGGGRALGRTPKGKLEDHQHHDRRWSASQPGRRYQYTRARAGSNPDPNRGRPLRR